MDSYLLIASRDPFEANDVADYYHLAAALAREGEVTLLLVQNGVFPARPSLGSPRLTALAAAGDRGIEPSELVEGVTTLARNGLAALCAGHQHVWHW